MSDVQLIKYIPYLALMGELCEYFAEKYHVITVPHYALINLVFFVKILCLMC